METKGFNFAAIPQTTIKVLTSPYEFFRHMPRNGGFVEPLVFMVMMGVVGGLIQAVISLLGFNLAAGFASGISSIIIIPVIVAIFGFVGAAIMFVIWKLMGSQESFETAYRSVAYIAALTPITTLLGIIPFAGAIAGVLLTIFLLVIASEEVHKLPAQKAWLVLGIIGAILLAMNISAQFAARSFSGRMEETSREMHRAARAMEKQMRQQSVKE
jgi:hypothetical protein